MGYPVEIFTDRNIPEEFLCSICQDVLQDPVILSSCEHTFCKSCITAWFKTSGSCPVDRQLTQAENNDIKALPRPFKSLVNNLRVWCKFKAAGCEEPIKLCDKLDHEEHHCEFKEACPGGCGFIMNMNHPTTSTALTVAFAQKEHDCVTYLKEQLKTLREHKASCKCAAVTEVQEREEPTPMKDSEEDRNAAPVPHLPKVRVLCVLNSNLDPNQLRAIESYIAEACARDYPDPNLKCQQMEKAIADKFRENEYLWYRDWKIEVSTGAGERAGFTEPVGHGLPGVRMYVQRILAHSYGRSNVFIVNSGELAVCARIIK